MMRPYSTRSTQALFEATSAGAFRLANRIVMAPLTRNRAGPGLVPGPFAVEYYAQRASAGLIIAEATQVSAQAQGYADTPGCYTDDQVRGWKRVTDAVHAKGGTMVVQLWHTGRVSHTSFQEGGAAPVGPSAIVKSFGRLLAYESLRRSNPRASGSRYGDLGPWRCRSGRVRRHDHAPDPSLDASLRDEVAAYGPSTASIETVQRAFGSVARKRYR